MAHLEINVDGKPWFNGDVDDWNPPPELPDNPHRAAGFNHLPNHVRTALAKALAKALETALPGFSVRVRAD